PEPVSEEHINVLRKNAVVKYGIREEEARYFVFGDQVENSAYSSESVKINILMNDGRVEDITKVSDQYELTTLTKKVKKYFFCRPKDLQFS
ncbi:MAG: phosphohydrolase, partial [Bacteroidota bacterium]|nr:phosphohydrolase [Bacteroidota bacterium]